MTADLTSISLSVLVFLITVLLGIISYFLKQLHTEIKAMRQELNILGNELVRHQTISANIEVRLNKFETWRDSVSPYISYLMEQRLHPKQEGELGY